MSANKFAVGDSVRVQEGLRIGNDYGGWSLTSNMHRACGEVFVIKRKDPDAELGDCYRLYDNDTVEFSNDWGWTDEMLEPLIKESENCDKSDFDPEISIEDISTDDLMKLYNI